MNHWKIIEGSLTTPQGFRAAAASAGIKKGAGALDLALIVSDSPQTTAAGVFTKNLAAAAPVALCRRHLRDSRGRARAILVNSGNANACTGKAGARAAEGSARAAAKLLHFPADQILIASTGVIGVPLNLAQISRPLASLKAKLAVEGASSVARAIMTTDTFPKSLVLRGDWGGKPVHLAGIAKGAGMIHPRMATMLCFITTDLGVRSNVLQHTLKSAVDMTFNRITVDGDTSTNDTVLVLASGASGCSCHPGTFHRQYFLEGLTQLCEELAKMIVRDGEGAGKLVTVEVGGAIMPLDADRAARAIANSPLVKTALAGSDPNWGRILCALGYSGATFDPNHVDIWVNDLALCENGLDTDFDEAAAKRAMSAKEVTLRVELHRGKHSTRIWTCDLTHGYIDINASYRT